MREPFDFLVQQIAQVCVELNFTSWKDWLEDCSSVFKEFVPLLALMRCLSTYSSSWSILLPLGI